VEFWGILIPYYKFLHVVKERGQRFINLTYDSVIDLKGEKQSNFQLQIYESERDIEYDQKLILELIFMGKSGDSFLVLLVVNFSTRLYL